MNTTKATQMEYMLGHSDKEMDRLEKQGEYFKNLTKNLLICAGISKGMNVLDFGAGYGDVAIIASELVGETGKIVALEQSKDALERARYRLKAKGLNNISLFEGNENSLKELTQESKFDAVIGRHVLLHQKDPVDTFCRLVKFVKPGGIVAFHESDFSAGLWTKANMPLLKTVHDWIQRTLSTGGLDLDISKNIVHAFKNAGIRDRHIVREGMIEAGEGTVLLTYIDDTLKTILPIMEKMKIVTSEEVQVETLFERMKEEVTKANSFFIPLYTVSAYGRTPA